MAEANTKKMVTSEESVKPTGQWKETVLQLAMVGVTTFLTGAAMAAGGHAYSAMARKLGGRPEGSVTPIRKVV